jgi:hypothetical protein
VTEGALFAIGSVVFVIVSAAILWYGYARFNEVYERDQLPGNGPPVQQYVATDSAGIEDPKS